MNTCPEVAGKGRSRDWCAGRVRVAEDRVHDDEKQVRRQRVTLKYAGSRCERLSVFSVKSNGELLTVKYHKHEGEQLRGAFPPHQ